MKTNIVYFVGILMSISYTAQWVIFTIITPRKYRTPKKTKKLKNMFIT